MGYFQAGITKPEATDLEGLERILRYHRERAIPYAVRNTLNDGAFFCRKKAVGEIEKKFTLRNRYTTANLRVDTARGTIIPAMESHVGHKLPYMGSQEEGFSTRAKGKEGVPIPSPAAGGAGQLAKRRLKAVRRPNWQPNIHTLPNKEFPTRAQTIAVAIARHRRAGRRYAFLPMERTRGIYKIAGSPKRRAILTLIWSLDSKATYTIAHKWLEPATRATGPDQLAKLYTENLEHEIRTNAGVRAGLI